MIIGIKDFKGAIPRLHPRLLPDNYAQIAINARLDDGTVAPVRRPGLVTNIGASKLSFYRDGVTWLSWSTVVDVARAPVATSRLYYTGDAAPKMRDSGTVYPLALAAPVGAPTVANLSTPDPAALESVFYAYTYVTGFGEESPPSPLSASINTSSGVTVRLAGFTAAPAGRNITKLRIYRSKTSASGATALYFVAEINTGVSPYDHTLAAAPLGEVIPSTDFDPPPATLLGLTAMPNGMMAAFDGKDVYFSEPYQPHAWPEKYVMTVDSEIIGLAAFGSNLAVLTKANPYLMQGVHPESMASEKLDKSLPCLSRRAIVDVGYAAYFPSTEGLAMISGTDATIVTRNLFTREQWRALSPDTFIADSFDGRYLFTYTRDLYDNIDAGDGAAVVHPDDINGGGAVLSGAYTAYDFGRSVSAFGEQRIGMLDLLGQQPFFIEHDIIVPTAMHSDEETGELFMLEGSNVMLWEDPAQSSDKILWRSKKTILPFSTNFSAALVQADVNTMTTIGFFCRIFADGELAATITETNKPVRLPSGFRGKEWEIEFESPIAISAFAMAHSVEELAALL